jgi:hypothetical protein
MMRLAFATGLLVLSFVSTTPARADFAVRTFDSGYCGRTPHSILICGAGHIIVST